MRSINTGSLFLRGKLAYQKALDRYVVLVFAFVLSLFWSCKNNIELPNFVNEHDGYSTAYKPTAPRNLQITGIDETHRTIAWQDIQLRGESWFEIDRKAAPNGPLEKIAVVPTNIFTWQDTTIIHTDMPYWYYIHAFGKSGLSSLADSALIVLPFPPPYSLSIDGMSRTSLSLGWKDSSSMGENVVIERRETNSDFQVVAQIPATTLSCVDENLDTTKEYQYRLKLITANNESVYSDSIAALYQPVETTETLIGSVNGIGATRLGAAQSSDDGTLILFHGPYNSEVYDVLQQRVLWSVSTETLTQAYFSRDGTLVPIDFPYSGVSIRNSRTGSEVRMISVPLGQLQFLTFNGDASRLIGIMNGDWSIHCWNVNDGSLVYTGDTHPNGYALFSVDVSPDGNILACSVGPYVELWDIASGTMVYTFPYTEGVEFFRIRFGPENTLVMLGVGRIDVWDLAGKTLKYSITDFRGSSGVSVFSDDGKYLIRYVDQVGPSYNVYGIWQLSDGAFARVMTSKQTYVLNTFSIRGTNTIASVYADGLEIEYDLHVYSRPFYNFQWEQEAWGLNAQQHSGRKQLPTARARTRSATHRE